MLVALILIPLPFFGRTKWRVVPNYLSGVGIDNNTYTGSMGATVDVTLRNWYMEDWFGERRIGRIGEAVTLAVIAVAIIAVAGGFA